MRISFLSLFLAGLLGSFGGGERAFAATVCYSNSLGQQVCGEVDEYNAAAKCTRTGVIGTAYGFPTEDSAIEAAVDDCVSKGGIRECCRVGSMLIDRQQ
jgi:hypothetical protein